MLPQECDCAGLCRGELDGGGMGARVKDWEVITQNCRCTNEQRGKRGIFSSGRVQGLLLLTTDEICGSCCLLSSEGANRRIIR